MYIIIPADSHSKAKDAKSVHVSFCNLPKDLCYREYTTESVIPNYTLWDYIFQNPPVLELIRHQLSNNCFALNKYRHGCIEKSDGGARLYYNDFDKGFIDWFPSVELAYKHAKSNGIVIDFEQVI